MAELSEADIFAAAGPGGVQGREDDQQERGNSPESQATVRATEERPTPNLGQLPDQDDEAQPAAVNQQQEPPRRSMLDDLKDERKKRQDIERQVAERDRQLAEYSGRMRALEEMFGRFQQPRQQEQPRQPEPAPDPFQDPEAFARHQFGQLFQQQMTPFQQELQTFQRQQQAVMADLQRQVVVGRYGEDELREAEEAFNTAAARGTIDPNEHRRINSSPNPYAAAVEWRRRNKALETVGNDPEKWFGSEFERRIQQDPAFKQQVFDMLQGQAQQGQAAGAHSPAAGRRDPVFTGLPSLNNAAGSSGRENGPMTEADLFRAAPAKFAGRGG